MKNLKSKLLASIAMLIVATIMMTSASFAWFTISTAPEITGIAANVTTNDNLEIALDNGSNEEPAGSQPGDTGNLTWGNLVELADYFDGDAIVLRPVKMEDGTVSIPSWGADGRLSSTFTEAGTTAIQHGVYTYDGGGVTYAIGVDFWLRTNVEGTISLSAAANRGNSDSDMGAGSTLTGEGADLVKVAFKMGENFVVADCTESVLSATLGTLAANSPTLVKMYVYMDGAEIENEDFLRAAEDIAVNVQFASSAVSAENAMDT